MQAWAAAELLEGGIVRSGKLACSIAATGRMVKVYYGAVYQSVQLLGCIRVCPA